MNSNTSIGRGPAHGSNENHDGDPRHKTMGETTSQDEPPMGNDIVEEAAPAMPAGVPAGRPQLVEASPGELDAAKGKLPDGRGRLRKP